MNIRWFDAFTDIDKSLWQSCFAPPYEGSWWYQSLEHCFISDQFKFSYGVIEREGKAIGIVPSFLADLPMSLVAPKEILPLIELAANIFPSLRYQRTYFIGSPCSDEGRVGLVKGVNLQDIVPLIQASAWERAKRFNATMMVWKDFKEHDFKALNELCESTGFFKSVSYPGTEMRLNGSGTKNGADIETYYQKLKPTYRYKLKKKLRIGKQALYLQAEVLQKPSSDDLEQIFKLFQQTYEKGKTKFEKLNLRFFELIAQNAPAHWIVLRRSDNSQMMAFMLCFKLGKHIINKFIGLDYSAPKESFLYFQLWEAAMKWVTSVGATLFQSGQTGYRAKIEVGNSLVLLTNYCKHVNPLVNAVYAAIDSHISWKTLDEQLAEYLTAHPEEDLSLTLHQKSKRKKTWKPEPLSLPIPVMQDPAVSRS